MKALTYDGADQVRRPIRALSTSMTGRLLHRSLPTSVRGESVVAAGHSAKAGTTQRPMCQGAGAR